MRGKTRKEGDVLGAEKENGISYEKRKESKGASAVIHLRESFSVLPQCEDKRL